MLGRLLNSLLRPFIVLKMYSARLVSYRSYSLISQEEMKMSVGQEKRRIYRNLLVLALTFFFLFTAYGAMANLQSSINKVENLGTWSNAAVYFSFILSCMFLPSVIIHRFKAKWTVTASILCYSTYIAAQFYPSFYTLIPTAFILGLGAAPLWTSQSLYVSKLAIRYAHLDNVEPEHVIGRFFGIFTFIFHLNGILGNFINTAVLSRSVNSSSPVTAESMLLSCGVNYCPDQLGGSSESQHLSQGTNEDLAVEANFHTEKSDIYFLATVFLASSVLSAVIIAVFLDPLERFLMPNIKGGETIPPSASQLLLATYRQNTIREQVLLVPLSLWAGLQGGFIAADFNSAFVTCPYGVHIIGRVMICFGLFAAVGAVSFGYLIEFTGRVPLFWLAAVLNLSVVAAMFNWSPSPQSSLDVYVMAALWAVSDAAWHPQLKTFYANIFPNDPEAAFSTHALWESLGFLISFVTQACGTCVHPKLVTVLISLLLGLTGYCLVEYRLRRLRRTSA